MLRISSEKRLARRLRTRNKRIVNKCVLYVVTNAQKQKNSKQIWYFDVVTIVTNVLYIFFYVKGSHNMKKKINPKKVIRFFI